MQIFLASTSPNRKELLDKMGIKYDILVPDYEEIIEPNISPFAQVQEFALGKAKSVLEEPSLLLSLKKSGSFEDYLVMGFDSMIYFDGGSIGKAKDEVEALEVLRKFVGKPQEIVTGFSLIGRYRGKNFEITDFHSTPVQFREDISELEIKKYLTFGDWKGKCGAYSILGPGIFFLESLEGDFQNIVGIPVVKIGQHIKKITGQSFINILEKA